ncbi:hypothetical protein M422DRAFT_66336 [Sphaerobolus stellatus SS14]|nr:hypothetical protein M422DRAFT_66336 [Sphaerobolus stellatus SS14]
MISISFLIPLALLICYTYANPTLNNTVYIISQAETPSLGIDGLTPVGLRRAQHCIPNVFNGLGIGLIISCTPDPDTGACFAAVATVTPLAQSLNLTVDTSCTTGDHAEDDCASNLIASFTQNSTAAILAVWDAGDEDTFVDNLTSNFDGIDIPDQKDDDGVFHHDVFTIVRTGASIRRLSQNCSGIDGKALGTGRLPGEACDT